MSSSFNSTSGEEVQAHPAIYYVEPTRELEAGEAGPSMRRCSDSGIPSPTRTTAVVQRW